MLFFVFFRISIQFKMSWIREDNRSFIHRFCNNVIRSGSIPRHVAFIMDGNRRFARKKNYAHAQGHLLGFDKLSQVGSVYFDTYCIHSVS